MPGKKVLEFSNSFSFGYDVVYDVQYAALNRSTELCQ